MSHTKRCVKCGRAEEDHAGRTRRCPIGRKHRTLGFTQYHEEQTYLEPAGRRGSGEAARSTPKSKPQETP